MKTEDALKYYTTDELKLELKRREDEESVAPCLNRLCQILVDKRYYVFCFECCSRYSICNNHNCYL